MPLTKIIAEGVDLTDNFAFTGTVTGAGEITAATTAPSEGSAVTTNVVQGLAKAWLNFNASTGTPSADDSLNFSSFTADGVGDHDVHFTSSFNNVHYSAVGSCFHFSGIDYGIFGANQAHASATYTKTTSVFEIMTGYVNDNGGGAAARDMTDTSMAVHGDLA